MKRYLQPKLQTITKDFIESINCKAYLINQTIVVFGGANTDDDVSSSIYQINTFTKKIQYFHNPNTDKFKLGQSLWQLNDKILLFAGKTKSLAGQKYTNTLQLLQYTKINQLDTKPIGQRFIHQLTQLPSPRQLSRSLIINQQMILLMGGNSKEVYEDSFILQTNENKWRHIGKPYENTPNIPYSKFSLALIQNKVYLFGGLRKAGKNCQISNQIFTLKVQNIQIQKNMSFKFQLQNPKQGIVIPIYDHEATVLDDRYMVVIGGETSSKPGSNTLNMDFHPNTQIWCYDTKVLQWFVLIQNVSPRLQGCAIVSNFQIYIFGGLSNYSSFNKSLQVLTMDHFKLDSICGICNKTYQHPLMLDLFNSTITQSSISDKNNSTDIFNLQKLVYAMEYHPFQAITLYIDTLCTLNASFAKIMCLDASTLLIIDDSVPLQFPKENKQEVSYRNKYLINVMLSSLRLGDSFLLLNHNSKYCHTSVTFATNRNTIFSFGFNHEWNSKSLTDGYDKRIIQDVLEQLKIKTQTSDQFINQSDLRKIQQSFGMRKNSNNDWFTKDSINELYIFNLKKNKDQQNKREIKSTFQEIRVSWEQSQTQNNSGDLREYLSYMHLEHKMSMIVEEQEVVVQDFKKYKSISSLPNSNIDSIRVVQICPDESKPFVRLYHNNRFLADYVHKLHLERKKMSYGLIVILKNQVSINIIKNRIQDKNIQLNVIRWIEQTIKQYNAGNMMLGTKRVIQDEFSQLATKINSIPSLLIRNPCIQKVVEENAGVILINQKQS